MATENGNKLVRRKVTIERVFDKDGDVRPDEEDFYLLPVEPKFEKNWLGVDILTPRKKAKKARKTSTKKAKRGKAVA